MDLLLIDANNLACKALHSFSTRTTTGIDTSVIYGFMSQLLSLRVDFKEYFPVIVWDGGHLDRDIISQAAVDNGFIREAYKDNRKKLDPSTKPDRDHIKLLQELISCTSIPQVKFNDYEADDVIASFCEKYKSSGQIICFTSDKDYYQLIDENVFIIKRLRGEQEIIGLKRFQEMFGIDPEKWVDAGALSGDDGDNIFGVPDIGEGKAINYIKLHGGAFEAVEWSKENFSLLRAEYPDISSQSDLDELIEFGVSPKKKRSSYDCTVIGTPYSGIALALERKQIKKIKKIDIRLAMYEKRVHIAYELKAMIKDIEVPDISVKRPFDEERFLNLCKHYEFEEVRDKADLLRDII